MALAPDNAPWYRRFRMLLIVYLLGLVFGGREFLMARSGSQVDPGSEEWSRMAEVIAELNPADADTDFLVAMEALQEGDEARYIEFMESALAKGVKHNNLLLAEYAHHLIRIQAPFENIDIALNTWRKNHQLSFEIVTLPLGQGPSSTQDYDAIRRELDALDWIYKWEFQEPSAESPQWVLFFQFEPAREAVIREVIEAISILGLPPEARSRLRVRCTSWNDCQSQTR
ncbi:MAG: hypothetical protein L7S64_02010 [Longimicrobiales bacterium]|jgi:sugar phosphate isomerase/epimerase|nr:hypothetical protein [Longimicrobiales bacterium]